jgi:F-type H+-transporting ATPase subunit epsilon
MATLTFELVTPEKLLVSREVAMVTVPGGEGDYSVLPGHAPMITTVKAGMIDIYMDENGSPSERISVAAGFAEVTSTRCTILAEAAPKADAA